MIRKSGHCAGACRLAVVGLAAAGLTLGAVSGAFAQAKGDITGIVRDSLNNEVLPNASVTLVGESYRTLTDQFGRFTLLNVPEGGHRLRVEYLGYRVLEVTVPGGSGMAPLTLLMSPDALELGGITVETSTDVVQAAEELSTITLSPRKLNTLPSLGETDVFRGLQLLPGVAGTNDATSGLFVRGGTPDENLVLLDGMTVYNVDHFFGVFSAFNSDAIKDVRLFKGGFPAEFGGRTSSVVYMTGRAGDNEDFNMSGGLNLLSARAVTEVPLGGNGSWLLSFRRSYTDLIQSGLYDGIFGMLEGAEDDVAQATVPGGIRGGRRFAQQSVSPSFYFFDLNSKVTYTPTQNDVVALSLYSGEDNLDESTPGQQILGPTGETLTTPDRTDETRWGNQGVSGRWSRQWGTRFTTDVLAAYSEYFSEGALDVASTQLARGFTDTGRLGPWDPGSGQQGHAERPVRAASLASLGSHRRDTGAP